MTRLADVWVIGESIQTLSDLCAGAESLGDKTTAVYFGDLEASEASAFADTLYVLKPEAGQHCVTRFTPTIIKLVSEARPNAVLLDTSKNGRFIAGCLAVALGTNVLTDSLAIEVGDEESVQTTRMVFGGAALRKESAKEVAVVVVGPAVFSDLIAPAKAGNVIETELLEDSSGIVCLEKREKGEKTVNLEQAKCIIGAGRGFTSEESLKLAYDLAEVLGGEIGCSRPIAEEEQWIPKSRYIGISGASCKPDLYICLGISGQVQHMVGINTAKTIVSINKNKSAPIFKQSDCGLVADLELALPKLIEELK